MILDHEKEFFIFGGISSRDYGLLIMVDSSSGIFDGADRDYDTEEIPGKDGELTLDNGRWKNVTVKYHCGVSERFRDNIRGFREKLATLIGPQRLEDSFTPDYFRIATLRKGLNSKNLYRNAQASVFDVEFSCKPQLYLKEGEVKREFTSAGRVVNPTPFDSKPLLRVYGTGMVYIGEETINITAANSYTDIDCEAQECYKDTYAVNCNGNVELLSGEFPTLKPGNTGISFGSGITKVILTPRWETR